ncbi:MAG: hypothetical protein JST26_13695 [Bacteroidetes bacterium]|nr:hypothetical protein [Bacteroidota bacterium]
MNKKSNLDWSKLLFISFLLHFIHQNASAGKEGQVSNQFKEDLFQIIDFLDVNKRDIQKILASEKLEQ